MSLQLSSGDLDLLASAQRAILSPLGTCSPDEWREEVLRQVSRLVDADTGAFAIVSGPEQMAWSTNIEMGVIREYMEYYQARELLPPEPGPAVHYLYDHVDLPELRRTEIFSDFWSRYRHFDNLALTLPVGGGQANLFFHHDRLHGTRFGERGKTLLGMLIPALEAGLHTYTAWAGRTERVAELLDRVEDGLLFCDGDGRPLHANPAFERVISADPEGMRLRHEAQQAAADLAALRPSSARMVQAPSAPGHRKVRTGAGAYSVRASFLKEEVPGGPAILVSLRSRTNRLPAKAAIRDRFGLTARQAEVALLLARRKTNAEVAEILTISPHTARRHTESVLGSLGIGSRRQVREALLDG